MAPAAAMIESSIPMYARIRLATKSDVAFIHKMIQKMADYYKLGKNCQATQEALSSTLFNSPPFQYITYFLVEVSTTPMTDTDQPSSTDNLFKPVHKTVHIPNPIDDPDAPNFCPEGARHGGPVVAGSISFFPNYSTFLARPGFYVEDLYVREGYRNMGLGRMLLKAVANQAVKMNYARVELSVIEWNVDSIRFYNRAGAKVLPDWRICRLAGDELLSFGQPDY